MNFSGLSAVVARTSGGREVASSILVAPTTQLNINNRQTVIFYSKNNELAERPKG